MTNEQHKLSRLEGGKQDNSVGHTELEDSKKEIARLQGELKLRVKLNQLQSAKVHHCINYCFHVLTLVYYYYADAGTEQILGKHNVSCQAVH